ncbi:MAG TPA: EVE domain-containing protein [Patescibacteria group bacterium]|nr:EVE domain-containing protein [Patescibacteria group bacterium]
MAYWLMKSEPDAYSWQQFVKDKKSGWTGVRNYQAAANMKAMKLGDECFFYHSNQGKEIVGTMTVSKLYHPDPTDETQKFGMVEVKAAAALKKPVTLADIKAHEKLKNMALVRQSRLSVSPVTAEEWKIICKLGGVA